MSSRGCVSWLNVARALASTTRQTAKRGAALWAAMCCAAALWSTPLLACAAQPLERQGRSPGQAARLAGKAFLFDRAAPAL